MLPYQNSSNFWENAYPTINDHEHPSQMWFPANTPVLRDRVVEAPLQTQRYVPYFGSSFAATLALPMQLPSPSTTTNWPPLTAQFNGASMYPCSTHSHPTLAPPAPAPAPAPTLTPYPLVELPTTIPLHIQRKLKLNERFKRLPAHRTTYVCSHTNMNGQGYYVKFRTTSPSGGDFIHSEFHVCDDRLLPNCENIAADLKDGMRHLQTEGHLRAAGIQGLVCWKCGWQSGTRRDDSLKRHQKPSNGRCRMTQEEFEHAWPDRRRKRKNDNDNDDAGPSSTRQRKRRRTSTP